MSHVDYLGITIGHAGRLNRQALRQAIRATQHLIDCNSPVTAVDIAIGGYDDDPREIYEIPEARQFVIDFATGLIKAGIPLERLLPMSMHLIRLCIAAEEGREITPVDIDIDIVKDIEAHQKRARRSMQ